MLRWRIVQTLAESYSMDAETYYLTGCVALAMDSYDEASSEALAEAYGEDATYDRTIQIYEAYLGKRIGSRWYDILRHHVENRTEKCEVAQNRGKVLLLYGRLFNVHRRNTAVDRRYRRNASSGMVLRTGKCFNARSMCQQYVSAGWQLIQPKEPVVCHL